MQRVYSHRKIGGRTSKCTQYLVGFVGDSLLLFSFVD